MRAISRAAREEFQTERADTASKPASIPQKIR